LKERKKEKGQARAARGRELREKKKTREWEMPIKEGGLPKIAYAQKREGRERDAKKRDSERRR
jgi:hypothetical protein